MSSHLDQLDASNHTTWQGGHREEFTDFDYDEVDRALLGQIEHEPDDAKAAAAVILSKLLAWVFSGETDGTRTVHGSFIRFIAFTSGLRPDLLENKAGMELAAQAGCTKQAISKASRLFQKAFGIHFARSRSDAARENMRRVALARAAKKKERAITNGTTKP